MADPTRHDHEASALQRAQDALFDTSVDEFFEGKWEEISLETLAGRANITIQTLLRFFGSKDGLLMQALARSAKEIIDQRWSSPTDDVKGAVENLLDHYEAWGERALRIGTWLDSDTPEFADTSLAARQIHCDWVDYAFGPQLGRLQGEARVNCRATIIALCDVNTWSLLSHDLGFDRPRLCAILTNAIERLLVEAK